MVFYRSFLDAVEDLPPKDFKACVLAILQYGMDGTVPNGRGIEKTVFAMAKPQIDRNNQKYINGSKGGRPRNQAETDQEPNGNQTETKGKPKKTDTKPIETKTEKSKPNNVNDNVNVIESDIYVNSYNACARARMDPPSVDEVRVYCREIGSTVDAQRFVDYYTANGWNVGKNPMRDWKAMVRRWETMQFGDASSSAPKGITYKEYTDEELNAMFTQITEDDTTES